MNANNSESLICDGSQVSLHFSLSLSDGSMVDSNFDGKPAAFVMGDGNLLPGFEKVLKGLRAGDEQIFLIRPEDSFGQVNPNNVQQIARDRFAVDMDLQPGLIMSFADAAKGEVPGVIAEVSPDLVLVDFNHPLAGRDIHFRVKILSVADAAENASSQTNDGR